LEGPITIFYINARRPGSVNDSRVLRNSPLFETFENGWRPFHDAVLIGDSGFPLLDWQMTPFAISHNNNEENYNRTHKRSRHFIETTFYVLNLDLHV
jgi:nuclease HARBI1